MSRIRKRDLQNYDLLQQAHEHDLIQEASCLVSTEHRLPSNTTVD